MRQENAFTIQERLRRETAVSVPWIQLEYGMSYTQAKAFLQELIKREWVASKPMGNQYPVLHKHLKLRKLQPEEMDRLIEDCNMDNMTALRHLSDTDGRGLTIVEVSHAVNGVRKAHEALDDLNELRLIYQAGDRYYCCVSGYTVELLTQMERQKRFFHSRRDSEEDETKRSSLYRIFDRLFADNEEDDEE